jgi:Xaa-Pro aminopeptidase
METQKVGIREFRDNLATYLGDTIGYYLPARRKPSDAEIEALRKAGERMDEMMKAAGVTEDEIVEDFKRLRKEERLLKQGSK